MVRAEGDRVVAEPETPEPRGAPCTCGGSWQSAPRSVVWSHLGLVHDGEKHEPIMPEPPSEHREDAKKWVREPSSDA